MAGDLSTGLSEFGTAVSDLFGSNAAGQSATSYTQAAGIADQNAKIAAATTNTEEMQETRALYKSLGTTSAQVGGAGFAESGSALDILRSSAQEGAIAKAITSEKGAIQVNSYEEQAGLFNATAQAASSSGTAQEIGGVLNAAGGAISLYNFATKTFGGATDVATKAAGNATSLTDAAGDFVGDIPIDPAAGAAVSGAVDAGIVDTGATAAVDAGTTVAAADTGKGIADAVALAVICTELNRQKIMSDELYASDLKFSRANISLTTTLGYHYWAVPYTKLMRRSVRATRFIKPFAFAWINQVGFDHAPAGELHQYKSSMLGKLLRYFGEGLCFLIGKYVVTDKDKASWQT